MKYFNITILISVMAFTSCCKKSSPVIIGKKGSYTLNNKPIIADNIKCYWISESLLAINILLEDSPKVYSDSIRENLVIFFRKMKGEQLLTGEYPDGSFSKYYVWKDDRSGIKEQFHSAIPDSINNMIEITDELDGYKKIKGKFTLRLVRSFTGSMPPTYPDTIYITDGNFETDVIY